MLTIKTKPDCTLGFVEKSYSDGGKDFYHTATGGRIKELIGKLSEITEEQAGKLFDDIPFGDPEVVSVSPSSKEIITYRYKLKSAALSVGIEEKDFDKFLIIRL